VCSKKGRRMNTLKNICIFSIGLLTDEKMAESKTECSKLHIKS
jgi:hypothetical protein